MCDQSEHPRDANVRAEYAALIAFHNSIVTHRFTLIGLFLAAVAIIVRDGVGHDEVWLILGFTLATFIIERRNRILYKTMGRRAIEIEENHWKFNRSDEKDKTVPLFHRLRLADLPDELTPIFATRRN